MKYPSIDRLGGYLEQVRLYSQLKHEYGAGKKAGPIVKKVRLALQQAVKQLKSLPVSPDVNRREPNGLRAIRRLRPVGPRRIWTGLDKGRYRDRLEGALLGRLAGCTLGAPVEFWPVEKMERWAKEIKQPFPPVDYWTEIPERHHLRYGQSRCDAYTRYKMNGVPVDDDITYTLLGLLIAEDHGPGFTTPDVGKAWVKYLPLACTAEDMALKNLKKGVPALKAGQTGNPYCEWIGADIRSDPWGYLAPGWPEKAAEMAYRDACLSHRRNGIYGEMYFSAAIAAAFAVDDPVVALKLGLNEIPRGCALAKAVRWALRKAPEIRDYRQARAAVEGKFKGMHPVHTINNACLTVWGITLGKKDFTRVISQTVAMGMDNDCTAATAGSIVGAVVGKKGIPEHWYKRFHDTVYSYMINRRKFTISGLINRFTRLAAKVHAGDTK